MIKVLQQVKCLKSNISTVLGIDKIEWVADKLAVKKR